MNTTAGSDSTERPQQEKKLKTRWERMQRTTLDLTELLALLTNAKRAERMSERTVEWYERAVGQYVAWLRRHDLPTTLDQLTLQQARAFTVDLQQQRAHEYHPTVSTKSYGLSDYSINSYLRALRAFANWLFQEGYTTDHPLARLKPPRLPKKVQDILTRDEVVTILTALNPHTEIGARDQAIFLTLLDTGIRASELCGLKLSTLHLEEGYATVLGKGRKERPIRIGALAARAIRFYVMHWRKPARPTIDEVFLTCRGVTRHEGLLAPSAGEPLRPNALQLLIKRVGRAAGVPRLHPHLLRHTFACGYLVAYRDPFALKSLLGHTTLAMTNHYCAAVQEMEIVRADKGSVLDAMDLQRLPINRRGRLPARKVATGSQRKEKA